MTYRGHVKKGVVVFDEAVPLPDGTEVGVEPIPPQETKSTLGQKLLKFAGKARGLPRDMARNHDRPR